MIPWRRKLFTLLGNTQILSAGVPVKKRNNKIRLSCNQIVFVR
jgi:hypothetical protein